MTRTAKLFLVPLLLLQILFFVFIAQHRFVDSDEGYFLLASRLVLLHKKPYMDFFFQQAPLLPYVYAVWLKLFHISWAAARLLPALLTSLLGLLLYEDVSRETRNWVAGSVAVVIFAGSALIFAWFPIAKPYSLAGLLLFAAYVVISRISENSSLWVATIGGILVALAADTRSYVILTVPLFLWWMWKNSTPRSRSKPMLWFLAGLAIGLLPCLYFFLLSPSRFMFDNLGYHAIRTNEGLVGMWGQKLGVLLMLFLGGPEGNGLQNSILFFVSLGFVFSIGGQRYRPRFAFLIAVVLALISLLPTPVLPQYFCLCIPFLVVTATCVINDFVTTLVSKGERRLAVAGFVLLVCIYLAASINDFRKYLITGNGIPTVKWAHDVDDWKLSQIVKVSKAIDEITEPGEVVASFWQGYMFQTHAVPFPGLETDCGIPIADKLTPEQRAKYHILSWEQMQADLTAHTPRVVVLEERQNVRSSLVPHPIGEEAKNSLLAHDYSLFRSVGDTSIYVCCSKP